MIVKVLPESTPFKPFHEPYRYPETVNTLPLPTLEGQYTTTVVVPFETSPLEVTVMVVKIVAS